MISDQLHISHQLYTVVFGEVVGEKIPQDIQFVSTSIKSVNLVADVYTIELVVRYKEIECICVAIEDSPRVWRNKWNQLFISVISAILDYSVLPVILFYYMGHSLGPLSVTKTIFIFMVQWFATGECDNFQNAANRHKIVEQCAWLCEYTLCVYICNHILVA